MQKKGTRQPLVAAHELGVVQLINNPAICLLLQVDEDNSGEIDFSEFCKVIMKHKAATAKNGDEADTIDAFIALGGNADKSGKISTEKLRATIKVGSLQMDSQYNSCCGGS